MEQLNNFAPKDIDVKILNNLNFKKVNIKISNGKIT